MHSTVTPAKAEVVLMPMNGNIALEDDFKSM